MSTKENKTRERIDLGLEAILSSGSQANQTKEIDLELKGEDATTSSWTLGHDGGPERSEFDALADERKWGDILKKVETRLADPPDVEAKLWWVRSHLGAFSMPVTFLAAPFEELCKGPHVSSLSQPLYDLLKETGLLALLRLEEIGAREQAASLREALAHLGIREERSYRERKRTGTSSFRSLSVENAPAASPATTTSHSAVAPLSVADSKKGRSVPQRVLWSLICCILVLVLFGADHIRGWILAAKVKVVQEGFVRETTGLEQVVFTPAPKDPGGALGAIFYSIGEESSSPGDALKPPAPRDVGEAERSLGGGLVEGGEKPQVQASPRPPAPKDTVDTTGPVEGREFRERTVDNRGSARDDSSLRGGPPAAVLPDAGEVGGGGEATYRVISNTSVLSAPSYGGHVIGDLQPGDRVLVEDRLGRWLRIRSKQGRGGYVLAVDVEEIPDRR